MLLKHYFIIVIFAAMTTEHVVATPPRRLQQISTIATRKRIITWMVQDESVHGHRGLCIRACIDFW